jgi:hypothetical protein
MTLRQVEVVLLRAIANYTQQGNHRVSRNKDLIQGRYQWRRESSKPAPARITS